MSVQDSYLFEDEFTDTDWLEAIDNSRTDVISRDKSLCKIQIVCPFEKYKAAVRFILGYSYVDEKKYLRREVPVFHPVWPWLFARAITDIAFSKATGKDRAEWEHAVEFATYTWARIDIEFAETRYLVLRDDEVTINSVTYGYKEWLRYVEQWPQSYVELAHIDAGQMKYYAPSYASLNGQPFIGGPFVLTRQEKSAFDLVWREVPKDLLYDSNGLAPKLRAIQKCVNSGTFLGRVAGTLLCEEIEAIPSPAPVMTDTFDDLSFTYDVTFKMKEFNPPRGDTTVDKYGWNLLPGVVNTASSDADRAIAYYYATHDGTLTGKPQFASYDYESVFRHHSL